LFPSGHLATLTKDCDAVEVDDEDLGPSAAVAKSARKKTVIVCYNDASKIQGSEEEEDIDDEEMVGTHDENSVQNEIKLLAFSL
jgi:hypothetical protein